MKKNKDFSELYANDYFQERLNNDPKRLACFEQEKIFVYQYVNKGNILDVGCSTGEFLSAINWQGNKYGMEISNYAVDRAKKVGVSFDKDIFSEEDFFDLIIFRGTIQHLDQPFLFFEKAYQSLKKGGYVIFLATPNLNSLYYKIWNDLPCLDSNKNFFVPSNLTLTDAMKVYGFELIDVEYPYLKSPYSNPVKDHLKFITKFFNSNHEFPFWKNMMNICFIKN